MEKQLSDCVKVFTSEDSLRFEDDRVQAEALRAAIDFEQGLASGASPLAESKRPQTRPRPRSRRWYFAILAVAVVLLSLTAALVQRV